MQLLPKVGGETCPHELILKRSKPPGGLPYQLPPFRRFHPTMDAAIAEAHRVLDLLPAGRRRLHPACVFDGSGSETIIL